ncbi:MAG: hypothetical protein PHI65_02885 [Firmicutes bacterium]|nr:hypothetical protein [Bacillota bacterium]
MLYLTRDELCDFYDVDRLGLEDVLLKEKKLGTIYYHDKPLDGLNENNYLAVVLPIMGEVLAKEASQKLPLLPFPVPKVVYESMKLDEEYLVLTLARYKLAHLSGDFSQNILFDIDEYQRSIASIVNDYDYLNPYQGKLLYWIDLKSELCTLFDSLPLDNVDDIVAHGRRIKVQKRTLGDRFL